MIELSQQEFKLLFQQYPQIRKTQNGAPRCPYCGNTFSPENIDYYNSCTESGTDCCEVEITCDVCQKVMWRGGAWKNIENVLDLEEAVDEVLAYDNSMEPIQLEKWEINYPVGFEYLRDVEGYRALCEALLPEKKQALFSLYEALRLQDARNRQTKMPAGATHDQAMFLVVRRILCIRALPALLADPSYEKGYHLAVLFWNMYGNKKYRSPWVFYEKHPHLSGENTESFRLGFSYGLLDRRGK